MKIRKIKRGKPLEPQNLSFLVGQRTLSEGARNIFKSMKLHEHRRNKWKSTLASPQGLQNISFLAGREIVQKVQETF